MHGQPIEDRLYPRIALRNRPVADERGQLLDNPRAARVESLDVRPAPKRSDQRRRKGRMRTEGSYVSEEGTSSTCSSRKSI